MIQLLVYNVVARQTKRAVGVVWAGLAALVALAPLVVSVEFLLTAVIVVEGIVLLVLLALGVRRTAAPAEDAPTGPSPA
jgi:hypothetical protein